MEALLETHGLRVTIGGKSVCRDLDFTLRRGERWALLGRNGAGKTTLLHTLAGLRPAEAGTITLAGRPLAEWPRRPLAQQRGVLFQHSEDPFPSTVLETALLGRHPHLRAWEWDSPADHALARAALARTGLASMEERLVSTLSGGERRRLALATLFVQNPVVMLLDEPTNHLDLHHQIGTLDTLRRAAREQGKAVLMAMHDINLAARYCDRALLLCGEGETLAGSCEEMLTSGLLSRVYGHPIQRIETEAGAVFLPQSGI